MRVLLLKDGFSAARSFLCKYLMYHAACKVSTIHTVVLTADVFQLFIKKKRHQKTRRSRVVAPADLEPPERVGVRVRRVRVRSGVGLVKVDVHGLKLTTHILLFCADQSGTWSGT